MSFTSSFSLFARQTVLLVGSGPTAAAMLWRLLDAGARVRWFSRNVDCAEEIWLSGMPDQIELAFREPRVLDFEEAAAVIATIGEPLASRVSEQAQAAGCPVNVVGRPDLSTLVLNADQDTGSDDPDGPETPPRRKNAWLRVQLACARLHLRWSLPSSFGI
jgi:siroheme synthase (precorrin-2 oxidase/ferrochelatase)